MPDKILPAVLLSQARFLGSFQRDHDWGRFGRGECRFKAGIGKITQRPLQGTRICQSHDLQLVTQAGIPAG